MPIVQGPDGRRVQFPDGTDPVVMHTEMTRLYAQAPKAAAAPAAKPLPNTTAEGATERGIGDTAMLGWGGNMRAADAALQDALFGWFRPGGHQGWSKTYNNALSDYQQKEAADKVQHPNRRLAGQAGGLAATMLVPTGAAARGTSMVGRMAYGAGAGGAVAATSAAGHAQPGDRLSAAATAAPFGMLIGGMAPPLASTLGTVAAPIVERMTPSFMRGGEMSGINALANRTKRAGFDPSKMRQRAEDYRAQGIAPTLTDVVDDTGRRVIATAARRPTPGFDAARQFSSQRSYSLPERMSTQARTHISGDPRTPDVIAKTATDIRDASIKNDMAPIRDTPIPSDDLIASLPPEEFTAAIRHAKRLTADPTQRAIMKSLIKHVNNPPQGDAIPPEIAGLGEPARSKAIADLGLSETPPPPPNITLDIADKIRRGFKGAAGKAYQTDAGRGKVLVDFGNQVRDHARNHVPEYGPILDKYGEDSGIIDATHTGEDFLKRNTDEFVAAADKMTPEEKLVARPAARRAIERASGENIRAAPGVAERIAISPEQHARNVALLGEEGAAKLEEGMMAEHTANRNAMDINPKAGSDTAVKTADNGDLINAAHAIGSMATGHPGGAMFAARQFLSRHVGGMTDADAERLVHVAIDPARTDEAINFLARKMSRKQAGIMVRGIRAAATRAVGTDIGGN